MILLGSGGVAIGPGAGAALNVGSNVGAGICFGSDGFGVYTSGNVTAEGGGYFGFGGEVTLFDTVDNWGGLGTS